MCVWLHIVVWDLLLCLFFGCAGSSLGHGGSVVPAVHVGSSGFPGGAIENYPPASSGDTRDTGVGKIPWGRKWQPTPVFLPGESHGQRSLAEHAHIHKGS